MVQENFKTILHSEKMWRIICDNHTWFMDNLRMDFDDGRFKMFSGNASEKSIFLSELREEFANYKITKLSLRPAGFRIKCEDGDLNIFGRKNRKGRYELMARVI